MDEESTATSAAGSPAAEVTHALVGDGRRPARERWNSLLAAVLACLCSGTVYSFGALHAGLKEELKATEGSVEAVAIAGNVGLWTGSALGGTMLLTLGPSRCVHVGGVLQFIGYISMYLELGPAQSGSAVLCAVVWFLCGHGCGWMYNAALFTCARNFREHRSTIFGILTFFFGLSSSAWLFYLQGCVGGRVDGGGECDGGQPNNSVSAYMLSLALLSPCVTLFVGSQLRQLSPAEVAAADASPDVRRRLRQVLAVAVGFLVYTCSVGLLQAIPSANHATQASTWAVGGLVLLLSLVTCVSSPTEAPPEDCQALDCMVPEQVVVLPLSTAAAQSPRNKDTRLLDALQTERFWLIWLYLACVAGCNVSNMNMTSTVIKDRAVSIPGFSGEPSELGDVAQLVISCTSALSRCMAGALLGGSLGIGPADVLLLSACVAVLHQVLLATGVNALVPAAGVLLGFSDGLLWTSAPMLVGNTFGIKHCSAIFGVSVMLGAAGVLLLGNGVGPAVYSSHKEPGEEDCTGDRCFRGFHITAAFVAAAGAAAILTFRYRR